MRKFFPFLIIGGLIAGCLGLVLWGTGCDEIEGPCEVKDIKEGTFWVDLKHLESWRIENGKGILRFVWPDHTIFFVCTSRTLDYQVTFEKRFPSTPFTVLPEARLIWKYGAPKPSKAVLQGVGSFQPLFEFNLLKTPVSKDRISLAYSDGSFGGYFIPGFEIRIQSKGNMSDDFNFVYDNIRLFYDYEVEYWITY